MGDRRAVSQIDSIVIHCAATPNGKTFTAEQIDQWHKDRGFKRDMAIAPYYSPLPHIGYHFVIEVDGAIKNGRPLSEIGAHAKSYNQNSVGICLIGTDQFTLVQWETLLKVIQQLEAHLETHLTLYGHNELSEKTCPGFDVPSWEKRKFRPLDRHVFEGRFT